MVFKIALIQICNKNHLILFCLYHKTDTLNEMYLYGYILEVYV